MTENQMIVMGGVNFVTQKFDMRLFGVCVFG